MKKAKIMLVASATFGIVGGALAVKASRSLNTLYYATASTAACSHTTLTQLSLTTVKPVGATTTFYTTKFTTTTCPGIYTIAAAAE